MASTTASQPTDERMVEAGLLKKILSRPELGAVGGAILVWIIFALVAPRGFLSLRGASSYLEVSAQLGLLAVGVSLLMIGGEFDLSIGSLVGMAGATMAILADVWGIPLYLGAAIALVINLSVGLVNGILVIKTKLPSFIITLGSLFMFRGLTIGVTRLLTGRTQIGGLADAAGYNFMKVIFASDITLFGVGFPVAIFWWFGLTALATWVLLRTQIGNWIFGAGGDAVAARQVGVPVNRLKIGLFMTTAFVAWLLATIQVITFKSADTLRGEQQEFLAIIAVVIGGTLLTGGYGSAIGAAFGALVFGMVKQGIVFAGVNADWFFVFMGAMLILAVLFNNFIRRKAEEARK